jgi:hypothetical protein
MAAVQPNARAVKFQATFESRLKFSTSYGQLILSVTEHRNTPSTPLGKTLFNSYGTRRATLFLLLKLSILFSLCLFVFPSIYITHVSWNKKNNSGRNQSAVIHQAVSGTVHWMTLCVNNYCLCQMRVSPASGMVLCARLYINFKCDVIEIAFDLQNKANYWNKHYRIFVEPLQRNRPYYSLERPQVSFPKKIYWITVSWNIYI